MNLLLFENYASKSTLAMRYIVLGILLTIGLVVHCHGGGVYLYEVNATEVGLADAGWAARADDAATAITNPAGMTRIESREYEAMLMPISRLMQIADSCQGGFPGSLAAPRSTPWLLHSTSGSKTSISD